MATNTGMLQQHQSRGLAPEASLALPSQHKDKGHSHFHKSEGSIDCDGLGPVP
ncbi:hypothetical protein WN943_023236 [Citrus x changshan-huyou]